MKKFYELSPVEQIKIYLKETGSCVVDLHELLLFAYSKVKEAK